MGVILIILVAILMFIPIFYRSWKLSKSDLIGSYINNLSNLNTFTSFSVPKGDIDEIKESLYKEGKKHMGLTIRQAIHFKVGEKLDEEKSEEKELRKIEARKKQEKNRIDVQKQQEAERKMKRDAEQVINKMDIMSGQTFEILIKLLYEANGYNTKLTRFTGDQGVDLIIYKDGKKTAVQCKRYNINSNVGNSAIQEVITGKLYYGCDSCIVVTNSYFTKHAVSLGNRIDAELIDREQLIKMIKNTDTSSIVETFE